MDDDKIREMLSAPFHPDQIKWRIAMSGVKKDGSVWAKCFAYLDDRAVCDRLDNVFGIFGWSDEFIELPNGNKMCGISVFDDLRGEWVSKWDGAPETDFEAFKGGLSDSEKRAAVKWGIGRYLYKLGDNWADINPNGENYEPPRDTKRGKVPSFNWDCPRLPKWALPDGFKYPPKKKEKSNVAPPPPEPERPNIIEPGADEVFDFSYLEKAFSIDLVEKMKKINTLLVTHRMALGEEYIAKNSSEMFNKLEIVKDPEHYAQSCFDALKKKCDKLDEDLGLF